MILIDYVMIIVEKCAGKGDFFIEKLLGTQFRLVVDLIFERDPFFINCRCVSYKMPVLHVFSC